MEVRLFGGLAVTVDGRPVALGAPKQRLVLAALAVEANQVVSVDRLIDVVWGDQVPNDPAASLQAYISNLRRVLEPNHGVGSPEVLVTQAPGYRLVLAGDDLDVTQVERLVTEGLGAARAGDYPTAIAHLSSALELSARSPVPELAAHALGVALQNRWSAQRGAAIEALVDAQLARGQHAEVAATIPRWIEEHPHREHLRAQHALALYRDGRQVEALRSIDDTRRLLADDVGLSLSPELHALEARILAHDTSLELAGAVSVGPPTSPSAPAARAVPPVPSPARRPDTALYGRSGELATLLAALEDASRGNGAPIVVSGEPGIGKTRLVQELVEVAAARGFAIGWGRCPESGAAPSFWAANQITEQLLAAGVLDPAEFGLLPHQAVDDAGTAGAKRFALQVTVAKGLRSATHPMLLVIDDVQWADAATLALLEFVASELSGLRALVVVTSRPITPESPQPLVDCLGELARQRGSAHMRLDGLDAAAVAAWLGERPGTAVPGRVVELVHDRSGGNPFYLGELVELLDSEGRLHDPRLHRAASGWVPAAVQDVIRRRVSRLPGEVQKLLSVASVVGRTFDADVLCSVADVELVPLFDLLDVAGRSGLVGAADVPGRFAFSHALVAEALTAELSAPRLAALHARVVDAIERLRADELEPHAAELAHHAFAAIAAGMARQALDYSMRAARLAAASVAHEDALVHWTRALRALDAMRASDDRVRYEVLVGLGSTKFILDDILGASTDLLDAARLARHMGDHVAAARAAAQLNHASLWEPNNYTDRDPEVSAVLEAVLADLPDEQLELRALVMGALANEFHHADRAHGVLLTDEALALARRAGKPETLVRTLNNRYFAHHHTAGFAVRCEVARELREVLAAHELPDEARAVALAMIALADREAGFAHEARELLAQASRAAEQSGSITLLSQIRFSEAAMESSAGNLEASAAAAMSGAEVYRRGRGFTIETIAAAAMLHNTMETHGAAAVAAFMTGLTGEEYATQWHRLLAWVLLEAGDLPAARAAMDDAALAGPMPDDWTWLTTAACGGIVFVALDDRVQAAASYEELLPYSGRLAWTGTSNPVFDAVDGCLGLLAGYLGDHDSARRHFAAAIALNERAGARMWLARVLVWQAEWLFGQGEVDAAHASLARAREVAASYGSVQVPLLIERVLVGAPAR